MRNAILLLALLCAACSSYSPSLPSIKPYRMDIQQGNVVTPKMMMQLKPGLTKAQVRFIMGTPLISDSFHSNRWDYFYSMKKAGHLVEQRRIILDFEDDKLKHVRGDVIPAGSADKPQTDQRPPTSIWENKPAGQQEEQKGVLDNLKFWGDDKKPEAKPQPEAKPEAAPAPMPVPAEVAAPMPEQKPLPAPDPAVEEKQKPTAAPAEEKGLLDKLKFWGDDDKKPEPKLQPVTKPESTPAPAEVVAPAPKQKPLPAPKPAAPAAKEKPEPTVAPIEERGLLDRLKFWGDDDKKPETKPAPVPVEVKAAKPQAVPAKPAPVVEPVKPKPVPAPEKELPPEDDPTYFERMMEKIGF